MDTPVICKDCGYEMGWHDAGGMLSPAFGGMMPCAHAAEYKSAQHGVEPDEGDEYDFTDPNHNPWLLAYEEAERLAALRRSR